MSVRHFAHGWVAIVTLATVLVILQHASVKKALLVWTVSTVSVTDPIMLPWLL
jgi:hypothetical protein